MKIDNIILRRLGKLLAVWRIDVVGMTNGWAINMQSPTSAQLAAHPSPAMAGQPVALKMTVTGTNPAAPPISMVSFQKGHVMITSDSGMIEIEPKILQGGTS